MGLMPIKAFLFIFVIFGFTKCSIDDGMFTFEEVHVIENEINTPILPLIEKKSTECFGILFCYISQLSLLNNKGNWKPKQSYDLTKKGESKLCENAAKLGHTNYEDQTWHGMIVLKKGENNFEIHADIFPKGETLPLKGITLSQLDSFIFGKDDSLKDKILEISQIDKEYMNPDSGLKPLLDDYPGLFALKYDMLAKRPENMQTKPLNRVFLWSYVDKCLVHRPNFISNRIELFASLRNLASCNRTQEKKSGLKYYETCKYKNGDENIMTESNSMNITLCYKSQLGHLLKNNPNSNYGNLCQNNENDQEMHGIEFQIYTTRVGFNRYDKEDYYVITFRVDTIVGFSYSTKTLSFGKLINVTGTLEPYIGEEVKRLGAVNSTEEEPLLFSIQLGNDKNNFASLKDEINGKVFKFENDVPEKYSAKNLKEIAEEEEGALSLFGPDINMKGTLLIPSDIEVISFPEKSYASMIKLLLNNETLEGRFVCYERLPNMCDSMGIEKHLEVQKAYERLLEITKMCPRKSEPRPTWITDEMLYIPNNTENEHLSNLKTRVKRSQTIDGKICKNVDPLIKKECDNTVMISFGDNPVGLKEIEDAINIQLKFCNESSEYQSRKKRQLWTNGRWLFDMLWKMPVYYAFPELFNKDLLDTVEEALKHISAQTCIKFEEVSYGYKFQHLLFIDNKKGAGFSRVGINENYSTHFVNITADIGFGGIIHEVFHALGLHHEMVRIDRNNFVWIYFDNILSNWSYAYNRGYTENYNMLYDYGSIMHYGPYDFKIDPKKFTMFSVRKEYQSTMGLRQGPSFKDVKLINRIYCTTDYPHWKSASEFNPSVSYECNLKEYELNKGKCKNGGYPDPLKNCKCRCPEGYMGNCEKFFPAVHELTASFAHKKIPTNEIISAIYEIMGKIRERRIYFIKGQQFKQNEIPKRLLIKVNYVKGRRYPCGYNHVEIKYLKDKSVTGARICCNEKIMPLIIYPEGDTDVLIIISGTKGSYDISYQLKTLPTQPSDKCRELRESIFDPDRHPGMGLVDRITGKEKLRYGPRINLLCDLDYTATINGHYKIENKICYDDSYWGPLCENVARLYCKKLDKTLLDKNNGLFENFRDFTMNIILTIFEEPNWYWETPEGEWIIVNEWSCYKHDD